MYNLPDFNAKEKASQFFSSPLVRVLFFVVVVFIVIFCYLEFFSVGFLHNQVDSIVKRAENGFSYFQKKVAVANVPPATGYVSQVSYEQAIINAVKSASPSVVSIVISKNLPVYQQQFVNPFGDMPGGSPFDFEIPEEVQKGTQYQEVGAGSGFIVSSDGLVLTNKHVVSDTGADYTVFTSDGTKYAAKVLALDPVQDLAIIKIQSSNTFPAIKIGDSSGIQVGQTAIAIGNALGQFSNTVSVGVVSGLGRTIDASEEGNSSFSETLEGIIQTDAAINPGNSGGPLLNLKGEVMGINTAMADGADSIGFAIPINIAKKDIAQIIASNKIVYPFLGVRYLEINDQVQQQYHLSVDNGALVAKGPKGEPAVTAGSAADKAGIKENDIIEEVDGQPINQQNPMQTLISQYNPGDTITLKILRGGKEMNVSVTLGSRS